jgi:hypothetical protein
MIVYKEWVKEHTQGFRFSDNYIYRGWFLFGVIPLYVSRSGY